MAQCDLCGRDEILVVTYTIYSGRSAGPGMTTRETVEAMPNVSIVSTSTPYKEFVAHTYNLCKRCNPGRFEKFMMIFGITFIASIVIGGVLVGINHKSVTAFQFFTGSGILILFVFLWGLVGHLVNPARRLKRKSIRSREGKSFEIAAWTEREFEQAFGKPKPD